MTQAADDCTRWEMIDRFRAEVFRHGDPATIDNMHAFMWKYRGMRDGETIREFEARAAEGHKQRMEGE